MEKGAGPSELVPVMVESVCQSRIDMTYLITYLFIVGTVIPEEWELGIIGKGKGDASETGIYTGLKLTAIILEKVEVDNRSI